MSKKEEMYKFLDRECPEEGGCMIVKATKDGKSEFLLAERHTIANGEMFTLNNHLFYDYEFKWSDEWEVIHKHRNFDGSEHAIAERYVDSLLESNRCEQLIDVLCKSDEQKIQEFKTKALQARAKEERNKNK